MDEVLTPGLRRKVVTCGTRFILPKPQLIPQPSFVSNPIHGAETGRMAGSYPRKRISGAQAASISATRGSGRLDFQPPALASLAGPQGLQWRLQWFISARIPTVRCTR